MQRERKADDTGGSDLVGCTAGNPGSSASAADEQPIRRPRLALEPSDGSEPSLVELCRRYGNPAAGGPPRLFETHHCRTARRQPLGEQFEICGIRAAACAVAEDEDGALRFGGVDK